MRVKALSFLNSLLGYFTVTAVLSFSLLILAVLYDGSRTLETAVIQNVKANVTQTSKLLNMTVSTYLGQGDLKTVSIFFTEMLDEQVDNGVTYVVIGGNDKRILLSTFTSPREIPVPDTLDQLETSALKRTEIHIRNPLLLPGREEGYLQYGLSTRSLVDAVVKEQRNSLVRSCTVLLVVFAIMFFLGMRISRRLKEITLASQAIVSGDYLHSIQVSGSDELAILSQHFNIMASEINRKISEITELNQQLEDRVARRTSELAHAYKLQEEHLQHLQDTKDQLVYSEKLAGLGSLVAGVAHELNTPLGNALTITTTLSDKIKEAHQAYENGRLKRTDLDRLFSTISEADVLLVNNISRAAELISSFKTIAVDQTSEMRRSFNLRKILLELELTLRLQLKQKKISLEIDVEPDINMDSFPGPLTQIIVNLFNNALIHAFDGREQGLIRLVASTDNDSDGKLIISFQDNGCGISKENILKIFDPFFTTKLGQGGSGLGLHISYNIVHGVLGGSISVQSVIGKGTEFLIKLPLIAPSRS